VEEGEEWMERGKRREEEKSTKTEMGYKGREGRKGRSLVVVVCINECKEISLTLYSIIQVISVL